MNHLFTTLGQVFVVIAAQPDIRVREIATQLRVTERTVMHALNSLTQLGLVSVRRNGRRNIYEVAMEARCDIGRVSLDIAEIVRLAKGRLDS